MSVGVVISGIVSVSVIGVLLILTAYGLFARAIITEALVGSYMLVYKKHIGSYSTVGPVMDEVYNKLKNTFGIETTKGFGLYYDNPREVHKDKLRSIVGCIVEGKSISELQAVAEQFDVAEYPASESVVAVFPYTGKLSIILGVFKVYPVLQKYITEKGYPQKPVMELYDQPNEVIQYITSPQLQDDVLNSFLV